jgi:NitT/TauT family transport system substrate-binding protein
MTHRLLFVAIVFSLALSACGQGSTTRIPVTQVPAAQAPATQAEPVTLRLALLRILDTLPMYVAEQQGFFAQRGIKVEFIPVASAAERDQIIAAGQADGMINEIVSTLFYNKDAIQIQIVRFARTASANAPMYYLLASKQSGITTPAQLKGVEIGISQGTIIEYLNDRLLKAEGLTDADIKTIAVPKIDERMSLLEQGQLKAALMPDPFASLALQQGAVMVTNDSQHPQYGYSTIAFRKAVIDEHPEAIRAFLAAIEDATRLINTDPSKFVGLLTEKQLIPAPLAGTYKVSAYPTASVPSIDQWNDTLAWAKEKGLIKVDVSYADSVNPSFLPK